jgi:hypothetical protein
MKKATLCLQSLFLAAVLISAGSCKKIEQQILKDPCADFKFCNIKSYTFPGFGISDEPNTATFTYDALGNPLTVNNTVVSTGQPNLIFRYDAAHRLSEFIRPYANGHFETWSKYVYDAGGRIAFDTTYVFGTVTPAGPADYLEARLTTYTYDGTCRILKTSAAPIEGVNAGNPPFVQTYAYDASGNLIRPGITYDNKVNIHRSNKMFMFVDRDYSMNNPFTATSYNAYSFPQVVNQPLPGPSVYFLLRLIDNATFVYQCD